MVKKTTENKLQTLSVQSRAIVSQLEQPLELIIFDRNINPDLERLLENYRQIDQKFQFKLVDPQQELGLAKQYQVQTLGEIYLQYGDKRQKLNVNNATVSEPITETLITNSIAQIKRDRTINIYLLQGHGEASPDLEEGGIAQVVDKLKSNGYSVRELNLTSQPKIPDNADLIIIAGATRKLLAAEVTMLQNYLDSGGNFLLLLSPDTEIGISSLLLEWGVELDNRLIVDGSGAGEAMGFGPGVIIVNRYGDHPIVKSFRNGISVFPESRPLKIQEKASVTIAPLVITDRTTWAESDLKSEEITFDPNQDIPGSLNIAIAAYRDRPESSRIVVFGSSTFVTNGWFEQQLNSDLLLNSVSWLVRENQVTLTVRPKEAANRSLNLSSLQAAIISWLALRIIPLLALIVGIFYWRRDR